MHTALCSWTAVAMTALASVWVASGCGGKPGSPGGAGSPEQPARQAAAGQEMAAAEDTSSVSERSASAGEAAPTQHAQREFNSELSFNVYALVGEDEEPEQVIVGQTPASKPLVIPACQDWWVEPLEQMAPADLIRELQRGSIPGLGVEVCPQSESGELLALLKRMPKPRILRLSYPEATDAGLEHLKGLRQLRELDLGQTQVTSAGLEHLKGLRQLRELDLGQTQVTSAGMKHLEGLQQLQWLDLSQTRVTDARLEHLEGLQQLQYLDLTLTEVTSAGLKHLEGLQRLQRLALQYTQVTSAGLEHLQGLPELWWLDVRCMRVDDAGLEHLIGVPQLQGLYLSETNVTDAGLRHLKGLPHLLDLHLAGTSVTDAGLEHLMGLKQLQGLHLGNTQVTDAGVERLQGLQQLTSLRLRGTQVTDAGLEYLKRLPHLSMVWLADSGVTEAGVDDLREAIPGLTCVGFSTHNRDQGSPRRFRQPTPEDLAAARKARQQGIQHLRDGQNFQADFCFDEALKHNPYDLESFVGRCKAYRATRPFGFKLPSNSGTKPASLTWMPRHVQPDGGWAFANKAGQERDFANPGTDRSRVRATALTLLSFAGAGQYTDRSQYAEVVRSGMHFLGSEMEIGLKGVDARGKHGDMVSHALATTVFCSVFHLKHDRRLQEPAQRMVNFIQHTQDAETGGWGLQPGTKGDTVATGWQMIALETARRTGLRVSEETLRKTAGFLDRVQSENGAYYGRSEPGRGPTATAMGLLSRLYLGWKPYREEVQRGLAYLHQTGPSTKDVQFTFVSTVLMKQCDPEEWKPWNAAARDLLVETQDKEGPEAGSWFDPEEVNAARGGRLYQTTLSTTTLEVYYKYLPLYASPKDLDAYPRPPLR